MKGRSFFFAWFALSLAGPLYAQPKILVSSSVFQGETLRVEVDGSTPNESLRLAFTKGFFSLFNIGPDAERGLIGIRLDATPGVYPLKLQHYVKHPGNWQTILTQDVEISTKSYPVENVNFTPDKTALVQWEHQESARIHKLLVSSSPQQYWEGLFDPPVPGEIIGEFGLHRTRNGTIDAGFHKGVDLRSPAGAPVAASASGVVLMAAPLKAHGRTVIVNHGQGVMTIYLHMKSFSVKPGQKVVKGEKLGEVGSSGLSTAPHVHWGVYVHGVPVDPKPWTEIEF